MSNLRSEIINIIEDIVDDPVDENATFVDLAFDSLDFVLFVETISEHVGIDLNVEELTGANTVGAFIDHVEAKL